MPTVCTKKILNTVNKVPRVFYFSKCCRLPFQVVSPVTLKQARYVSGAARINTGILFVPQQEAWVIERFGKFKCILEPVSIIMVDYHNF